MNNDPQPAAQGSAAPEPSVPFSRMTFTAKCVFVSKVVVFLVSGGFLYPTIFTD